MIDKTKLTERPSDKLHLLVRIFPAKWWALLFPWALFVGINGNWHAAIWCAIASCGYQAIAEVERNSNDHVQPDAAKQG